MLCGAGASLITANGGASNLDLLGWILNGWTVLTVITSEWFFLFPYLRVYQNLYSDPW